MGEPEIPEKLYFKIGEVARIVGVEPHVLRYWESEFGVLRPGKTRSRHRLYRRRDIEALLEIRRLLHEERYTIEGARKHLRSRGPRPESAAAAASRLAVETPSTDLAEQIRFLADLRRELQGLVALLEQPPRRSPRRGNG